MPGKPKGLPKTGGRKKGATNKLTDEARSALNSLIEGQVENIKTSLESVRTDDEYKYLTLVEKFLGYVMPKKKDITSDDKPIQTLPITGVRIEEDGASKQPSTKAD